MTLGVAQVFCQACGYVGYRHSNSTCRVSTVNLTNLHTKARRRNASSICQFNVVGTWQPSPGYLYWNHKFIWLFDVNSVWGS